MRELWEKIKEALVSALPITLIVYLMALLPWFDFSGAELITFTVGAVLLIAGIGLFSLGADVAMTPMGTHVGAGLSRQKKLSLLLIVCFVLGLLITVAVEGITGKKLNPKYEGWLHGAGMVALLGLMALIMFKDIFVLFRG